MAADASLSLERISQAMHAMFEMLSKPDVLPEFNALQVSSGLWPSLIAHLCIAEPWSVEHTSRNCVQGCVATLAPGVAYACGLIRSS